MCCNNKVHNIDPLYDNSSEILILGSFPSVVSRNYGFYYMNKQNRFWKVLSNIFEVDILEDIDFRKDFLKSKKIALWDIIHFCNIVGSKDSSIKDIVVNDINKIVNNSNINRVYANGKKAFNLYKKHFFDIIDLPFYYLPSTSSANNVNITFDNLCMEWKVICK